MPSHRPPIRPAHPKHPSPCIVVLADEWFPTRGGISALNCRLGAALAAAGAELYCVVPAASAAEQAHAARAGVRLVVSPATPGGSERDALMRRPPLPPGVRPDVLIGHGRVTGPAAKVLADDHFPEAARLHVVHLIPEVEWWKPDRADDAGERAEERTRTELELARTATRVVTIGPRLDRWWRRELSVFDDVLPPLRLDPGFDGPDQDRRVPPGSPQILFIGRLEDAHVKGLDLMAKAVGYAQRRRGPSEPEIELLVRGAPRGQAAALRDTILAWSGSPSLRVTVRNYSADLERLEEDLRRASLVLMPSRAEAFGLVGLEAIVAGTPVLLSDVSGLGMLVREVMGAEGAARDVVPVGNDEVADVECWGREVDMVLRERSAAFARATYLRRVMAGRRTWAMAATRLLEAARLAVATGGRRVRPSRLAP